VSLHEDKAAARAEAAAAAAAVAGRTAPVAEPQHDRVLMRVYEAPDGFRGTYDEVAAHEETLGLKYGETTGPGPSVHDVLSPTEVGKR
jgi:hypothetical protein